MLCELQDLPGGFKRKHIKPNNAGFFCLAAPSRSHLEEHLPVLQPVPHALQHLSVLVHHARLIVHCALLLVAQHGVHLAQDLRDAGVAERSLGERSLGGLLTHNQSLMEHWAGQSGPVVWSLRVGCSGFSHSGGRAPLTCGMVGHSLGGLVPRGPVPLVAATALPPSLLPLLPPCLLTWKRRVASSFCSGGTRSGCRRSEARW